MPTQPPRRPSQRSTRSRSASSSVRKPVRARRRPRSRAPQRLVGLFVIFTLAFGGMGVRLVVLQAFEAPAYAKLAAQQRERSITLPARRGAILDREGEPLGISVDLHTVWTDPALVEDVEATARRLSPVLHLDDRDIAAKLRGSVPGDRYEEILRQVEPELARKVRALELPGIYLKRAPKRYYPGGRLASHLLGFVGIDGDGLEGVELQYDDLLSGEPGTMTIEQDPAGRALPQVGVSYEKPVPGRSLLLTLDKELQYFTQLTLADAAERFHAEAGTAIIMRPDTGEILAMANVPDFDPNEAGRFSDEVRRNRAVTDVYEPGSAYKIVATAGALERGVVTPRTGFTVADSFAYSDRVFHDSHAHATERMTVAEIIADSSNVGTIQIGLKLGAKHLDGYVRRFGFGEVTGLDFPGESPGIVLDRDDWSGSTIATIPIGQGIAVTPLQMATAYSTLANGGVWTEPKLLSGTLGDSGRIRPSPPPARKRVVSRATARKMARILTGVTEEGTGIEAQIPGYQVAGKTGTAQKPLPGGGYGNSYIASFAGFAPANRPEIVVIVVLDNPSPIWGGSTAAPTFRTISEFALRHLGVAPTGDAERAAREIQAEQAEDNSQYD